ncbi:MAG TPA: hypothetical protein VFH06_01155 [Candidatus Saccharimonadales bacterium]|nr:hypothetical protein [Candidatus Saccharimonadales bacterium]
MTDDPFDLPDPPHRAKRRKEGAFIWILLTLVVLGGLSVLSLILGSAAMDDDAVSMDPGQVFQGLGVAGIILTLVVIVVIIIVSSE